jgi:lysophospholipase L1-like esterase
MLGTFFGEEVTIHNAAMGGRSSKSFIDEGRLAAIDEKIGAGDYLLIQFGHNDEKEDEARHTTPDGTFPAYLMKYIEVARAHGATSVLLSSVERRRFNEKGEVVHTHGDYPDATERLAREAGVAFIDLRRKSKALLESLGDEPSKRLFCWLKPGESPNYPDGVTDNTHFSEDGAKEMARLVVEGIRESGLPLAGQLAK